MSEWALKRFWSSVDILDEEDGFAIQLDGRPVRTPGKRMLVVPTRTIASHIAEEWDAQTDKVDPRTMPWTCSANSAIDKVATQRAEVTRHLIGYAGTDLLCYRAEAPVALIARQQDAWDPVLDWLAAKFGVRLAVTAGVMPVDQDPDGLGQLAKSMEHMSDFQLTGFHDLVTLTGSFGLGLAAAQNFADPHHIWSISRLDEDWQIEQWGEDEEASNYAMTKKNAFIHATELYHSA